MLTSSKDSVFVLGAGASVDLNLPIGSELTDQIRKALNIVPANFDFVGGDDTLRQALYNARSEFPQWLNAARQISASMPLAPSIDNFVDVHRHDTGIAFCAKAAITQCILKAERQSTLRIDRGNIYKTIEFHKNVHCWHTIFFRNLTINCPVEELSNRLQRIGVISFNYDRCFEHFLLHAIATYYNIRTQDAADIMKHLEIYHPYGKVGELPEMNLRGAISYGENIDFRILTQISRQIKTFTESTDESSDEIKRIREMAISTHKLIFLGFAFHPINVNLLFPSVSSRGIDPRKQIIATALGSSKSDLDIIKADLGARYECHNGTIDLRSDLKCLDLFNHYSRTLSFA